MTTRVPGRRKLLSGGAAELHEAPAMPPNPDQVANAIRLRCANLRLVYVPEIGGFPAPCPEPMTWRGWAVRSDG